MFRWRSRSRGEEIGAAVFLWKYTKQFESHLVLNVLLWSTVALLFWCCTPDDMIVNVSVRLSTFKTCDAVEISCECILFFQDDTGRAQLTVRRYFSLKLYNSHSISLIVLIQRLTVANQGGHAWHSGFSTEPLPIVMIFDEVDSILFSHFVVSVFHHFLISHLVDSVFKHALFQMLTSPTPLHDACLQFLFQLQINVDILISQIQGRIK